MKFPRKSSTAFPIPRELVDAVEGGGVGGGEGGREDSAHGVPDACPAQSGGRRAVLARRRGQQRRLRRKEGARANLPSGRKYVFFELAMRQEEDM